MSKHLVIRFDKEATEKYLKLAGARMLQKWKRIANHVASAQKSMSAPITTALMPT
jgi:hypothetical protein